MEELSGRRYGEDAATDRAMRIVAEHTRAAAFLIADGVMPGNEKQGYSVRQVLRRAIYFGQHHLGLSEPFVAQMVRAHFGIGLAHHIDDRPYHLGHEGLA